jgi:hypothetical protein
MRYAPLSPKERRVQCRSWIVPSTCRAPLWARGRQRGALGAYDENEDNEKHSDPSRLLGLAG